MRRRILLAIQFVVITILTYWVVIVGIGQDWAFKVFVWDVIAHILGGLWVGFAAAWVQSIRNKRTTLAIMLVSALFVGTVWEVFEYVSHMTFTPFMSYGVDTAKDLCDDVAGALLAWMAIKRLRI